MRNEEGKTLLLTWTSEDVDIILNDTLGYNLTDEDIEKISEKVYEQLSDWDYLSDMITGTIRNVGAEYVLKL